jgi:hypothetical protein
MQFEFPDLGYWESGSDGSARPANGVWVDRRGCLIEMTEMADTHLENTQRMLERGIDPFQKLTEIRAEIDRRKQQGVWTIV